MPPGSEVLEVFEETVKTDFTRKLQTSNSQALQNIRDLVAQKHAQNQILNVGSSAALNSTGGLQNLSMQNLMVSNSKTQLPMFTINNENIDDDSPETQM